MNKRFRKKLVKHLCVRKHHETGNFGHKNALYLRKSHSFWQIYLDLFFILVLKQ